MPLRTFLFAVLFFSATGTWAQLHVSAALCDNRTNPTGIDVRDFFFSWNLSASKNNEQQSAYQYGIASSPEKLAKNEFDVHSSGKILSPQSIQIVYTGKPLKEGTTYYWKIRVWDVASKPSLWSKGQQFTTGLYSPGEWKEARWIGHQDAATSTRIVPFVHGKLREDDPRKISNFVSPYLRKSFSLTKKIRSGLLFVSGMGHYTASINGQKIGQAFLAPGWTEYDKTILYNTYDITDQIQSGNNVLGVQLGNGFYSVSQERYVKGTGSYGSPKMIALLKLQYTDGSFEYIVSDGTWKTYPSPVVFNNIYGGEDFDATQLQKGWDTNSYYDSEWKPAVLTSLPKGKLRPEIDYPVTLGDTVTAQSIRRLDENTVLYDFGQNLSGIPKLLIKGKPGQTIKITPSELLFKDGRVNQYDGVTPHFYQYTIGSDQEESWHPEFTYFAVRYLQVEGAVLPTEHAASGKPLLTDLKLLHNRNSTPSNGYFSCSDSLFNRIFSLVDWAVKSNLQSYITDNPQREKLSWQGEQNFMRTAINYNYDMYNMYRSLIQSVQDAQHANGLIPDIAPEYMQFDGPFVDSPEWGTTGILNLWFLYKFYGDTSIIRKSYSMMKSYAQYLEGKSKNHLLWYGLGDWLDVGNKTPMGLTASAYYYKSIRCLADMAGMIGQAADASYYSTLAQNIKAAFNKIFFKRETGIYATGSQTAMAMPLALGLVEEQEHARVLKNLVTQIERVDSNRLTAGDVGHKFLVRVLFENNLADVLYNITHREDAPGYAYQLNRGATSLVETWDGKGSHNQLAMGHILDWFHEGIVGISQEKNSIAFKHILIKPQPVGALNAANGGFHSPYGWIRSNWQKAEKQFSIQLEIPVNTKASVVLPAGKGATLSVNGQKRTDFKWKEDAISFTLPSGEYSIQVIQ